MVTKSSRIITSLMLAGTVSSSAISMAAPARADCPNEPVICLAVDYEPGIYGGCAIATNLDAAPMCWSWLNFQCLPCSQDSGMCNTAVPDECQGNCEAVTGLEYYQRCDSVGGNGNSARMSKMPSVPAMALLASTISPPQQKWVGTITPPGGKAQRIYFYSWAYGDQQHLRIEFKDIKVWSREVVREKDALSFTFFENGDARCELNRSRPGPFVGTCTEPKGGTAQIKMWPQPL